MCINLVRCGGIYDAVGDFVFLGLCSGLAIVLAIGCHG